MNKIELIDLAIINTLGLVNKIGHTIGTNVVGNGILTNYDPRPYLLTIQEDVRDKVNDYKMKTSFLADYYGYLEDDGGAPTDTRAAMADSIYGARYRGIITTHNVFQKLSESCLALQKVLSCIALATKRGTNEMPKKVIMGKLQENKVLIEKARSIEVVMNKQQAESDNVYCQCGEIMSTISSISCLKCLHCGMTTNIYATVLDNGWKGKTETDDGGPGSKGSQPDYIRHLNDWMRKILGKENKCFDPEDINKIRSLIIKYKVNPANMNLDLMRHFLKEARLVKLNDHTTLLLKMFTDVAPPELTSDEVQKILDKCCTIFRIYDTVCSKGNKPYYLYFISKCVEQLFVGQPDKLRLLDYIYQQSPQTTMKNDEIYKKICSIAKREDDLVFVPTKLR